MKSFNLLCVAVVLILSEKIIVNGQENLEGENTNAVNAGICTCMHSSSFSCIPNH